VNWELLFQVGRKKKGIKGLGGGDNGLVGDIPIKKKDTYAQGGRYGEVSQEKAKRREM